MLEINTAQVIGGLVALIGFIGLLLRIIKDQFDETKARMIAMEERHRKQNDDVIDLTGKIARIEGSREGFLMGMEKISAEVIAEIKGLGLS